MFNTKKNNSDLKLDINKLDVDYMFMYADDALMSLQDKYQLTIFFFPKNLFIIWRLKQTKLLWAKLPNYVPWLSSERAKM